LVRGFLGAAARPALVASPIAALILIALVGLLPGGAGAGAGRWEPSPGDRWQYQLESSSRGLASTGGVDVSICEPPRSGGGCVRPDVFDIDLYVDGQVSGNDHTVNTAAVQAIHDRGAKAVCYVSAGTAERFRPDYSRYVAFDRQHDHRLLGKPFSARFPNEYWLNLANADGQRDFILRRVDARTEKCAQAGFDGIEYDVVDAYAQGHKVTGWRITARQQLAFDRSLAAIAHRHGLSAGLKNDLGQVPELEPRFDFAINEQCFQYRECANNPAPGYRSFTRAGKAVFEVEYRLEARRFCGQAARLGISAIKKAADFSLAARPWKPCR
jgi:endo-alpha-1,4-polygalactosaminidase (GH114 family)